MTLKQVLIECVEMINNGLIDVNTSSAELTRLIECGNFIYSEIADVYSDLRYSEEKVSIDGKINYSDLTKTPKKILKVTDNGADIAFIEGSSYLDVGKGGTYTVEYAYKSSSVGLNDTLDIPACFTEYCVSCGVTSEYFFRVGLVEEALFYKNRYDKAVVSLTTSRRKSKLKARRFL